MTGQLWCVESGILQNQWPIFSCETFFQLRHTLSFNTILQHRQQKFSGRHIKSYWCFILSRARSTVYHPIFVQRLMPYSHRHSFSPLFRCDNTNNTFKLRHHSIFPAVSFPRLSSPPQPLTSLNAEGTTLTFVPSANITINSSPPNPTPSSPLKFPCPLTASGPKTPPNCTSTHWFGSTHSLPIIDLDPGRALKHRSRTPFAAPNILLKRKTSRPSSAGRACGLGCQLNVFGVRMSLLGSDLSYETRSESLQLLRHVSQLKIQWIRKTWLRKGNSQYHDRAPHRRRWRVTGPGADVDGGKR